MPLRKKDKRTSIIHHQVIVEETYGVSARLTVEGQEVVKVQ